MGREIATLGKVAIDILAVIEIAFVVWLNWVARMADTDSAEARRHAEREARVKEWRVNAAHWPQ
jgi:hypothetical protein